jgi:hypothetical protein
LASILFQEPLGMVQVIGGAVVLAGISITQFFSGMRSTHNMYKRHLTISLEEKRIITELF